ncbi:MAG: uroporphyrinogen-III synthase [Flavobacteriales bacterium]|nr:uroporphyrinogen-III synthase [Flavobacteriales bacterium]
MKVKTILVSQPKPENDKSPYFDLAQKNKLAVDFRSFIHVEGIPAPEFRKQKIGLLDFDGVIFTSRNAVDHYFRMADEMRVPIPDGMKYFCTSESTAYYLQKYVVYRKRKIFHGKHRINDVLPLLKKHPEDKFLLPTSDQLKPDIPETLDKSGVKYTRGIFYRTVCSDLSDLADVYYDMLVFFSPSGIKSLFQNFPDFKQNHTRIATFGASTKEAAEKCGLLVNVPAPTSTAPSMTMAIEHYVKEMNKK